MDKKRTLLLIFTFFLLKPIAGANDDCLPASCGPHEPQVIYIDPEFCRPNRIISVNLTDTPFRYSTIWRYTFYNCSLQSFGFMYPAIPFPCLSTGNYSVVATRTGVFSPGYMPSNCQAMNSIVVPVRSNTDFRDELELMWFTPYCRSCEVEGEACGLRSDDGQTVCVGSSHGIPKSAKYGLSIGIGVPALIGIIGLAYYASSRAHTRNDTHNQNIDLFSIAVIPQPRTGLDGPTIESYPKTILGESCRLPNDDGICAICLSDYKPKESHVVITHDETMKWGCKDHAYMPHLAYQKGKHTCEISTMDMKHILLLIFSFFVTKHITGANADCSPASCGPYEPDVRFPFRIVDQQPVKCGFPGFDLSCDQQNKTIIQLPSSFSYIVNEISYEEQFIQIDPEFCRPNHIVSVNVTDTPFGSSDLLMQSYTFFNCSQNYSSEYTYVSFPCLSSGNYSVIAIKTNPYDPGYVPSNCTFMKTIGVPVRPYGNIKEALQLMWQTPYCKSCERAGEGCEWKNGEAICVDYHGKGYSLC
ncbi:hypothetical protein LXL04_005753 [Taraxacum kok-saghyz]